MSAESQEPTRIQSKPHSPTDLTKPSWGYVLGKTVREFSKDEATDIAAALTYYAVLALFPALIALLAIIGLTGESEQTVDTMLQIVTDLGGSSVADTLEPIITQLANAPSAGLALVVSVVIALWSASGYTSAFGRAMNRMYGVREGRPVWKFRPVMLLVTAILVTLAALVLLGLVLTGPVVEAIGSVMGLGSTAVTVWEIAKWPVMLLVVVMMVAILYWATPNIKQPKFRWMSTGAGVALAVWILASAGFGFYVANFSSYEQTYGALAGAIVFLLWLWITNLALLFGAELDAELERGRELQAGIAAEEHIQLPLRDTAKIDKADKKMHEDVVKGRQIRLTHGAEETAVEDDNQSEKE
ncbi:YihY/virulence factor BrkB family protein [Demequina flava]|uniref:YihY/virulence factor BrkB family protein n=1 Tax=Demequina flava TaxID=1095025 RepID=UPI0007849CE7|nr:YihY/virulence factor BrkB family protein [Demequina flava]